jgi:hypothetical protein
MVKEEFVTTHSRNVGGDRKEKRAYGIMNTKKEIIFCFCRRMERKCKENVCFLHPTLFFITPVYNDPTENEKRKFTPFLNFVFPF